MFNQYVLILVWLGFMALLQGRFYREEYNELIGEYECRVKPLFAFIVMMPVIWIAANRGWFADTAIYIAEYRLMPTQFSEVITYAAGAYKDKGFAFLSAILHCILGYDYFPYLLSLAVFQGIAIIGLYKKYSTNYVYSIFLFLASTDYISWMFNGMRQFMAVTIILFAVPMMLRKRYVSVFAVILIASTMHQSALIMIPFVIIAQGDVWNRKTVLFMLGAVLAVSFVGQFTTILNDAMQSTQYSNMVSDYTSWQDDGTNPLRVLVYSIPAALAFVNRKRINTYGDSAVKFAANMSVISMGLYLVSMVTSGIFIGRLPIYCSLFGYILLPWIFDNCYSEGNRKMLYGVSVVFYLAFYYYGMHIQQGII